MTAAKTACKTVAAYTDGSCLGNPGPGGWAVLMMYGGHVKELAGGLAHTTNNRMEILAAVMALESLREDCKVDLYTDSRYVRDAVEKGWLRSWQKNGWKTADKKPVKNQDLWQRLLPQLARHKVSMHWVAGHAGHMQNERVDVLARHQATLPGLEPDVGYTG